jgi:hypothetical protein
MGIRKARVARNIVTLGRRQLKMIYCKQSVIRTIVGDEAVNAKQGKFCGKLALLRASRDAALSWCNPG